MFKLHIYNPEHDIALAKNNPFFTPPKAAQLTRDQYCHIPALWADDGDLVLVDDVQRAKYNACRETRKMADVRFISHAELIYLDESTMPSEIVPWGWDRHIVRTLVRANPLFASLVPSDEQLDDIRLMSSRGFVADEILPRLVEKDEYYVGEMGKFTGTVEVLEALLAERKDIVAKSPWSCSGRGVRFLHNTLNTSEKGWIQNVISEQGYLTVEPIYNKVLDFAMEFYSQENGVEFRGINVFETREGKYLGNLGNNEDERTQILQEYIPSSLIERTKQHIIEITSEIFHRRYTGPFGIDMMIVTTAENETKVHPCVEMNLRRTMGQI